MPVDTTDIKDWFTKRLPKDWYALDKAELQVLADREEVVVICPLAVPEFEEGSDTDVVESVADGEDLSALGAALDELAAVEPLLADIVDLKFFCGFTVPEIAAMKRLSERTVERSWQKARVFLHHTVRNDLLSD